MDDLITKLRSLGPDFSQICWGEITCLLREAANVIEELRNDSTDQGHERTRESGIHEIGKDSPTHD